MSKNVKILIIVVLLLAAAAIFWKWTRPYIVGIQSPVGSQSGPMMPGMGGMPSVPGQSMGAAGSAKTPTPAPAR